MKMEFDLNEKPKTKEVFQKYMDNDIHKDKDFLVNWVLWKVLINNFDSYIQMADFFF